MNLAHLHLLLNHFPTVGMMIAFGLFAGAFFRDHEDLKKVSLVLFFGIAVITFPTYMTGAAAQMQLRDQPGISSPLMAAHEDAAMLAFLFMEITGVIAWFGLWQYRRNSRPANWVMPTILVLSIVSFVLMARAANIGGDIRHPEIQSAFTQAGGDSGTGLTARVAAFANAPWTWPALETIHFVGLSLLCGIVFLINLRMLGGIKGVSYASLHRLLPLAMLGFGINVVTGMLFFTGTPEQYVENVSFYWKVLFMLLAGLNALYFTIFDEPWRLGPGDDAPMIAKVISVSTLVIWFGVIYFGRMLPYLGNSF